MSAVHAQSATTGRIVGRVIDVATGQPIIGAAVQLVGTTQGAQSGVEGRYAVTSIPAGTVSILVRRIGYSPKTVTGLVVAAGQSVELNVSLATANVSLQAVTVSATKERGTVSEALSGQKNAQGVVNSVTSEQIAKSPDANAAQAVQRVSGVTVQDGKYVFVRGLGERYTTASLNGARVPSPEPEKRVVPLDLFPSGLLQNITTIKTFTPDQQGDFSGALVDIRTKEFPARRSWSANLGSGYEQGATGSDLLQASSAGGENFANVGNNRALPGLVRQAGNLVALNLNQGDKNLLISQFRNSWTPASATGSPLLNGSLSVGGNDPILFGHRLGYLFSGTYSNGSDAKTDQVRAQADRGTTRGQTIETDKFSGSSDTRSVLWGGLTNLSTQLGDNSRIAFNGIYNRSADNTARVETGVFSSDQTTAKITRQQYVERSIRSAQLTGDHQYGNHHVEWYGTLSGVRRYEPDRSEFVQILEQDTPTSTPVYRWFNSGNGGAVRTFTDLNENSREGNAKYTLSFGDPGNQALVRVGGLYRSTDRDADNRAYNISARGITNDIRALPPELLFDGRLSTGSAAVLDIGPLSQGGAYTASDRLSAGFAMVDIPVRSSIHIIGGARYEQDRLSVNATSTLGNPIITKKNWDDVLPSLAVNWKLDDRQQVRFSASQTLARPEYRELSPIISRDVVGGDDIAGNPDLKRSNITNGDIRWEFYQNPGEIISVGVFAKHFENPIERAYRASSSARQIIYVNAQSANNYGVELELRKNLEFIAQSLSGLSVFTNATIMQSRVTLDTTNGTSQTNSNRRMVGQAPYVLNAGLTYTTSDGNTSATVLYNRVGERIDAAGESPLPDVIQKSRNVMDISLRWGFARSASLRADLRNVLNAPYETVQGTVVRESYLTGRTFTLGLRVQP
jgi:outer membrane receptor protein involved in Fe transport